MKEQRYVKDDGSIRFHREKPSRRLRKAVLEPQVVEIEGIAPFQHWENDQYYGTLRTYASGNALDGGPYAVIGITSKDETARHDWREFQQIKNDLVGKDWEGVELYPAESRLIDPSNRFYLFCFPPQTIKWGLPGRRDVQPPRDGGGPQRPFPEETSHDGS